MTATSPAPVAAPGAGLGPTDRARLLALAVAAIEQVLRTGSRELPDPSKLPPRLQDRGASFVTLRRSGRLLGCIGTLEAYQPLGVDVAQHSMAAAFDDPRFSGIGIDDFEQMLVEVSVLGPAEPVAVVSYAQLPAALRPGVDGVIVRSPGHCATFLPAVWSQVRGAEQFCSLLWRKAGLEPGAWPPGLVVSTYQVVAFEQPGPRRFGGQRRAVS